MVTTFFSQWNKVNQHKCNAGLYIYLIHVNPYYEKSIPSHFFFLLKWSHMIFSVINKQKKTFFFRSAARLLYMRFQKYIKLFINRLMCFFWNANRIVLVLLVVFHAYHKGELNKKQKMMEIYTREKEERMNPYLWRERERERWKRVC